MYQARELLTQGNILGDDNCTLLEDGGDNGEEQRELEKHPANDGLSPNGRKTSAISPSYPIMTRHRTAGELRSRLWFGYNKIAL